MHSITVLTATYNRAHLLPRLYNSLLTQTNKEFEWMIVDDGSTDGTEQVIKNWIDENRIVIKYLKKENEGCYYTLRYGSKEIKTEFMFLCDSDDYLTNDAIDTVLFYIDKYKNYKEPICGFAFHRATKDGKISGGNFPQKEAVEHYHEYQLNQWNGYHSGETARVFFTEIFREFLPKIDFYGKRKISTEDIILIPMGFKYKTVYINKVLQIYEYQKDGYSKNLRLNQNYRAQYERGLLFLNPVFKIKYRLRGALMASVYSFFLNIKPKFHFLVALMYLPGFMVYKIWKWKYGMED